MGRKPKFWPRITRIKLDPEQAVLSCTCYVNGWRKWPIGGGSFSGLCSGRSLVSGPAAMPNTASS